MIKIEKRGINEKVYFKLLLSIYLLTGVAFAEHLESTNTEQLISKSVFVQLSDPGSHKFQKNKFAYFPAGTKLKKGDFTTVYKGKTRRLVYAENGIEAYIKEGMYWNQKEIKSLIKKGGNKWVFITRAKDIIAPLSPEVKLVIGFSRGEKYSLFEEDEDSFTIEVGQNKVSKFGDKASLLVKIPRINAKLVDLSKPLVLDETPIFKLSIIDGITGIKKQCNKKTIVASRYTGNVEGKIKFSLKTFWAELTAGGGVNVEKETEHIEDFDKNENVSRRYCV